MLTLVGIADLPLSCTYVPFGIRLLTYLYHYRLVIITKTYKLSPFQSCIGMAILIVPNEQLQKFTSTNKLVEVNKIYLFYFTII